MSELLIAKIPMSHLDVDADDIVHALGNNDDLVLSFIIDMLDRAGSSELEETLMSQIKERLGVVTVTIPHGVQVPPTEVENILADMLKETK